MFPKLLLIVLVALVAWGAVARTSSGAGHPQIYVVRASDTLWSIASAHYPGDPREGVWKLEQRNGVAPATLRPGAKLVLP